jgi:hypothetical protein
MSMLKPLVVSATPFFISMSPLALIELLSTVFFVYVIEPEHVPPAQLLVHAAAVKPKHAPATHLLLHIGAAQTFWPQKISVMAKSAGSKINLLVIYVSLGDLNFIYLCMPFFALFLSVNTCKMAISLLFYCG